MTINNEQERKATHEAARKRRQTAAWFGVIGIVFVVVLGILLINAKALEIGGIGILLVLVLLRIVPGIIGKHVGKNIKEDRGIPGDQEEGKDTPDQRRE
jgi:hypothetical protein